MNGSQGREGSCPGEKMPSFFFTSVTPAHKPLPEGNPGRFSAKRTCKTPGSGIEYFLWRDISGGVFPLNCDEDCDAGLCRFFYEYVLFIEKKEQKYRKRKARNVGLFRKSD